MHGFGVSAATAPVGVPHVVVTVGAQAELPFAPMGQLLTVVVLQVVEPLPSEDKQASPETTQVCPRARVVPHAGASVRVHVGSGPWVSVQMSPDVVQMLVAAALTPQIVPVRTHVAAAASRACNAMRVGSGVGVVPGRRESRARGSIRAGEGVTVARRVAVNLAAQTSSSATNQRAVREGGRRMTL